MQRRFLREMEFSEIEALARFRLAPLCSRRDMGMLGVLHKVVLGTAPDQLKELFPVIGKEQEPLEVFQRLRHWKPRHDRQLHTEEHIKSSDVFKRFGLVRCYSRLPQRTVDSTSVKAFQRSLQCALLHCAENRRDNWQRLFSTECRAMHVRTFDELFE